ncbi:MAG: energy transducer TonB [Methylococcaceae bacterium]|nr:energy transducer TonB [Methylococcaceae bacterium]
MKIVYSLLESNQMNKPLFRWSPIELALHGQDDQKYRAALCTALVILLHILVILRLMQPAIEEIKLATPLPIEVTLLPAPKKQADAGAIKAKPIEKPKTKTLPPKPKPVQKQKPVAPKKAVVKPVMPDTIAPVIKAPALPTQQSVTNTQTSASNTSNSPTSVTSKTSSAAKTDAQTDANFRPYYSSNPKPQYPSIARSRHLEGKVLLKVKVSAEGHSVHVSIDKTSGFDMLDNAAIEAVQNWKFAPARRGDTPVACTVTIPISFKLQD